MNLSVISGNDYNSRQLLPFILLYNYSYTNGCLKFMLIEPVLFSLISYF